MAESRAPQGTETTPALGLVRLAGRLGACRVKSGQNGQTFLHLLLMPAKDQYSHPATCEVVSKERLGNEGHEVSIVCEVGGYSRVVTPNDQTKSPYRTADNSLRFVRFA